MAFKQTRYASVEGKTVEYVETTYEEGFITCTFASTTRAP
jgi:hypothetical protein